MILLAYVHRTLGFGENEQSVQNQLSSTLFVWDTVVCRTLPTRQTPLRKKDLTFQTAMDITQQ